MSNELKTSENVEKLKKLITEKKFIEASNCADDVVRENENSGEAWLLYFLAYNSKTSLDECTPYDYSMNEELINKIENLGDDAIKKNILKFKEKVNLIKTFIEKKNKILNLAKEINDYAKYAYGHVGENAIKALNCAEEMNNNINENSVNVNYNDSYNVSPLQVKKGIKEVLSSKILDDVNRFLEYKEKKQVEMSNLKHIYEKAKDVVEKCSTKKRNIENDIDSLRAEEREKNRTIQSNENEKLSKKAENERLAIEKVECEKQLELNQEYKIKYNNVENRLNSINTEINKIQNNKNRILELMRSELAPLEAKLKSYDTNDKRILAMEKQNRLSRELENSNITNERQAAIKNELSILDGQIRIYDSNRKLYIEYEENIARVKSRYNQEIANVEMNIRSYSLDKDSLNQELNSFAKLIAETDKKERINKINATIDDNIKRFSEIDSTKKNYIERIERINDIIPEKNEMLVIAKKDLEEANKQMNEKKKKYDISTGEYYNEKDKVSKLFYEKNIKDSNTKDPRAIDMLCDYYVKEVNAKDLCDSYCKVGVFNDVYNRYFLDNTYVNFFNKKFGGINLNNTLKEFISDVDCFDSNLEEYHNEKIYVDGKNILFVNEKFDTCVGDLEKLTQAENIFKGLGQYKDSEELVKLSIYTQGCMLYDPKPKIALEKFTSINDYKDSAEWIQKCETLIKERHEALMKKIKIAAIAIAVIAVVGFVVMKLMKYI